MYVFLVNFFIYLNFGPFIKIVNVFLSPFITGVTQWLSFDLNIIIFPGFFSFSIIISFWLNILKSPPSYSFKDRLISTVNLISNKSDSPESICQPYADLFLKEYVFNKTSSLSETS